jgi:hypothetical protein
MKTLIIILAVVVGLCVLCALFYQLMNKPKKIFFKQQIKALPHMLPRYFV